jgi:hypothetical protein
MNRGRSSGSPRRRQRPKPSSIRSNPYLLIILNVRTPAPSKRPACFVVCNSKSLDLPTNHSRLIPTRSDKIPPSSSYNVPGLECKEDKIQQPQHLGDPDHRVSQTIQQCLKIIEDSQILGPGGNFQAVARTKWPEISTWSPALNEPEPRTKQMPA